MLFQSIGLMLAFYIPLACLSSYQTIISQDKEKIYIFVNRTISNALLPFKIEEHEAYLSCITACQLMTNCVVILIVLKYSNRFECRFFDESTNLDQNTEYATSTTTYLVKKGTGFCGKRCAVINSMNKCGSCRCRDSCGITKKHQCDCTKNVKAFRTCQEIFDSGQQISGKYLIDPDGGGGFETECHVQRKEYINHKEICTTIKDRNNWFNRKDIFKELGTFYECKQYCYQNMKNGYNDWTYNYVVHHCRCEVKDSDNLNPDSNAICCTAFASNVMSFNQINKSSAIMLYRSSESDPKYWNKPLSKYEEGFSSADNIWIGLKQLERITAAFLVDIKVIITTSIFKDKVTTFYRNVKIKRSANDFYAISYETFDPNDAREEGYFDRSQIVSSTSFKSCNSMGYWWNNCPNSMSAPTNPDTSFGFGMITDIYSIAFLLQTAEKSSSSSLGQSQSEKP